MTPADIVTLALTFLLGPPRTAFYAHVLAALGALCPCPAGDAACDAHHRRAARAIAVVATEQPDPEEAAALLLGTAAHETGASTERQAGGGPAVSYWQVEVPKTQRAALLADPVAAARVALRAARACGGTLRAYATGTCDGGGDQGAAAAADLRRYVASARYALAAH